MIRRLLQLIALLLLLSGGLILRVRAADSDSQAGMVITSSGSLNVRSQPSAAAASVAKLARNSTVTLISKDASWWKVEYAENCYGYCHADYIRTVTAVPMTVATTSGGLNIRSGAGTNYQKVGTAAKGEVVLSLSETNGWSRILYDGTKTGYVSTQYLSGMNPSVFLWVRSMKQTDSRWAQKEVASSGKTFAQIGCATTAIAMLESHRTGVIRYPDEMMTLLKYTPSGSVYWPSHYKAVTDSSNYLSEVYALLRQGKPVLFGATNGYGSQHWVVVTGFTGGSISSDKFTILDPGSNSRTTLLQLLEVYPNFYKYFYY